MENWLVSKTTTDKKHQICCTFPALSKITEPWKLAIDVSHYNSELERLKKIIPVSFKCILWKIDSYLRQLQTSCVLWPRFKYDNYMIIHTHSPFILAILPSVCLFFHHWWHTSWLGVVATLPSKVQWHLHHSTHCIRSSNCGYRCLLHRWWWSFWIRVLSCWFPSPPHHRLSLWH